MMEQLSYLPFGNPNSGAEDVLLHLNISDYQYRNVYRTYRNKVKAYVVNLMYKDDSLSCSYAAWLVYGCEKYIGIVNKYLQRRKKAIKKLNQLLKPLEYFLEYTETQLIIFISQEEYLKKKQV